jgi:hypothetical protein
MILFLVLKLATEGAEHTEKPFCSVLSVSSVANQGESVDAKRGNLK